MIFATVGTQLPFPRLIGALDSIAARHRLEIFAQTADPATRALHLQHVAHVTPSEFAIRSREADLLVGHAGIGTVLTAKKLGKPVILFPRRADLGEHRNDHQLATARAIADSPGVHIAWNDGDLERLLTSGRLPGASLDFGERQHRLVERLRAFILDAGDGRSAA